MATWLQNRLKAAEEMLEAVDRTAKTVAVPKRDAFLQLKGPTPKAVTPPSDVIPTHGMLCTDAALQLLSLIGSTAAPGPPRGRNACSGVKRFSGRPSQ